VAEGVKIDPIKNTKSNRKSMLASSSVRFSPYFNFQFYRNWLSDAVFQRKYAVQARCFHCQSLWNALHRLGDWTRAVCEVRLLYGYGYLVTRSRYRFSISVSSIEYRVSDMSIWYRVCQLSNIHICREYRVPGIDLGFWYRFESGIRIGT